MTRSGRWCYDSTGTNPFCWFFGAATINTPTQPNFDFMLATTQTQVFVPTATTAQDKHGLTQDDVPGTLTILNGNSTYMGKAIVVEDEVYADSEPTGLWSFIYWVDQATSALILATDFTSVQTIQPDCSALTFGHPKAASAEDSGW